MRRADVSAYASGEADLRDCREPEHDRIHTLPEKDAQRQVAHPTHKNLLTNGLGRSGVRLGMRQAGGAGTP